MAGASATTVQETEDRESVVSVFRECCESVAVAVSLSSVSSALQSALMSDPRVSGLWTAHKELEGEDHGSSPFTPTEEFAASTRKLCREVRSRGNLAQLAGEVSLSAASKEILETLAQMLRATREDLDVSLGDDSRRRETCEMLSKGLAQGVRTLGERERDLARIRAERTREQERHAQAVQKIRDETAQVEQLGELESRQAEGEARNREEIMTRAFREREASCVAETSRVQAALEEKEREHRKREVELRKKKQRTEKEVHNWLRKYDSEMSGLVDETDEADCQLRVQEDDLRAAEAELASLHAKKRALQEEEKLRQQQLSRQFEQRKLLAEAARRIQRWWRRLLAAREESAREARLRRAQTAKSRKASAQRLSQPSPSPSPSRGPRLLPPLSSSVTRKPASGPLSSSSPVNSAPTTPKSTSSSMSAPRRQQAPSLLPPISNPVSSLTHS